MLPVDHIYVLNLDHRYDRWNHVSKQLETAGLTAERFSAIDGSASPLAGKHTFRTDGELGCLLTHTAAIQDAMMRGYERIAVFEDDVLFHRNFKSESSRLAKLSHWKLVYLGATQLDWSGIKASAVDGFYHPCRTYGTWAMLIARSEYEQILREYRKLQKTADSVMAELYAGDESAFVASPNLCITDLSDSDIRKEFNIQTNEMCRWQTACYESPRSSTVCGSATNQCRTSLSSSAAAG